ncbi:hypothetical protein COOONC_12223 [Cooperia oncophora]
MPPEGATEAEVKAVERIRSRVADVLHPRYDTYFNILRWLQSYDFNEQKTLRNLRRHLKFRKERHMDEDARDLQSCAMSAEYAPISIIGPNRKNGDRLIVIDQGGEFPFQRVETVTSNKLFIYGLYFCYHTVGPVATSVMSTGGARAGN